jgi:uncharacterized protein YegL
MDNKPKLENPSESHLACVLLLDTSSSMSGSPIASLNEGVRSFIAQLSTDEMVKRRLDIAIVEFNDNVNVVQEFSPISQINPVTLTARGCTSMGQAVQKAIDMVKERNLLYASKGVPAHKPWIFMITDGAPTDSIDLAVERVQQEEKKGSCGKLKFWSLAVEGADKNTLRRFSERVLELDGYNFTGIFDWAAKSMSYISVSQVGSAAAYPPLPSNVVPAAW